MEGGGASIVLDAGVSLRELTARLASIGRQPSDLDAVFLTHEHSDHMRGVGPLVRRFGLPVYSTEGTYRAVLSDVGRIPEWRPICADQPVRVGELVVEPWSTPHDAEESVAFVIRCRGRKLGHATDLGEVTSSVCEKLAASDVLLVEANHDVAMLEAGPYPWPVKQRIKSNVGHLSNESCGELLASVGHANLRLVVLMHLSQTNNHPDIARITARQALGETPVKIMVSGQDSATALMEV